MDRYIESLLPQDLLLEMDADDQNRYVSGKITIKDTVNSCEMLQWNHKMLQKFERHF